MLNLTIRPATTRDDLLTIQKLAHQIWPVTYGKILSAEQLDYMLKMMYAPEVLGADCRRGVKFFLAQVQSQSVGFAAVEKISSATVKLHKLYLDYQFHDCGIGRALMQTVKKQAQAWQVVEILLNVNKFNLPAQRFYEQAGFVRYRAEKNDIGHGYFMDDFVYRYAVSCDNSDQ